MLKFFLIYMTFSAGLGLSAFGIRSLYMGNRRNAYQACCFGLAYMILATMLVYQHT